MAGTASEVVKSLVVNMVIEIVAAMKLKFRDGLETKQLVDAINTFEIELKKRVPEVRWSFIEPDHSD